MFVLCLAVFFIIRRANKPQPEAKPSGIEQNLVSQFAALKSTEITYRDSISELTAIIDRLNKKGIPAVNHNWQKESERVKRLSTDEKMLMFKEYIESTEKLQKLIVSNDTIVGLTTDQFADVGNMIVDLEYQSLTIDSLFSLCDYYRLNQEQYLKLIDNLTQQNVNFDNRLKVKDDLLRQANEAVLTEKKHSKKNGTKRFFQGLGLGGVAGFIGGIIVIL